MKPEQPKYDAIVIGSGPAGMNAAISAANLGARTLIVERETEVGGACVQYGTIPSKTLRETAVTLSSFRRRSGAVYEISHRGDLQIESLMTRLHHVVEAHQKTTQRFLDFAGVESIHGQAEFVASDVVRIRKNDGRCDLVQGDRIFIATGSRPRNPPEFPIDHENVLDSDSVLSMAYLPQSLVVFGGGVIACEYASTFATLGVRVVIIDKYAAPLGFLDADLVEGFVERFQESGGQFLGNRNVSSVAWNGLSQVVTTLESGEVIETDKALVAQGRVANTDTLRLENADLQVTDRGLIRVDEDFQTDVKTIYAVGDAIGPPSLASSSMHQGRSAASHAFGVVQPPRQTLTPMGIYTIPEIASVGIDEKQATQDQREILIGRADFTDIARGQIIAAPGGFLKLIADEVGSELLGVQIVGDGATELIHVGQMAITSGMTIDQLATANFNFPTLAEAYRLAALDLISQRASTDAANETALSERHHVLSL